jgi:hypothetical protein
METRELEKKLVQLLHSTTSACASCGARAVREQLEQNSCRPAPPVGGRGGARRAAGGYAKGQHACNGLALLRAPACDKFQPVKAGLCALRPLPLQKGRGWAADCSHWQRRASADQQPPPAHPAGRRVWLGHVPGQGVAVQGVARPAGGKVIQGDAGDVGYKQREACRWAGGGWGVGAVAAIAEAARLWHAKTTA